MEPCDPLFLKRSIEPFIGTPEPALTDERVTTEPPRTEKCIHIDVELDRNIPNKLLYAVLPHITD